MAQEEVGFANSASKSNSGVGVRMRNFGHSICNTEKGEFLGRTASSWAKIGVFYVIFYSCLAGFFAVMLIGFFATLDDKEPTQKKMYSLIKANPGMGFRPMASVDSTLIKFNVEDPSSFEPLIASINKILKDYRKPQNGSVVDCSVEDRTTEEEVCHEDLSKLGPCGMDSEYGYANGTPCVLLKLNRVYDWVPEAFSPNETENADSSEDVKNRFKEMKAKRPNMEVPTKHIAVTCEGENDADHDNMGSAEVFPSEGFPFSFYPYKKQTGYRSPLVFVRFPKAKPGVLIQVWCKVWARNIKHHKNDRAGSTHFEIFYDKATQP